MRRRRRQRTDYRVPWWLVAILIANLIFHMIPQEWIIGPAPSLETLQQETEAWLEEVTEPAAEILLDESRWLGLNDRKKVRVLERLAAEQAQKLALRKHLSVEVADLEEGLAGQYDNEASVICIDENSFRSARPERLMYIVCHEVRHAYQFALADAWMNLCGDSEYADLELFSQMEACYEGLNSYCHAAEGREAYENQWVEVDAREYADGEVMRIIMGGETGR